MNDTKHIANTQTTKLDCSEYIARFNSALVYGCFYAFKSPYLNLTLTSSNTVGLEVHTLSTALNKIDISLFCASTECSMGNPLHTLILSVRLDVTPW